MTSFGVYLSLVPFRAPRCQQLFASFIAIGVLAFCGSSAVSAQVMDSQQPVIRLVGHPEQAPDFLLAGLDGKPVSIVGARGKIVLLNFWATWCGPCRAETPDLVALQNKYKDALEIIGLAVDVDDPEEVQKFAAAFGINYPMVVAPIEVRMEYGGITSLPTSFLLDTEGRIVQKHVGLSNPLLYELEIRALLHLAIPARVETFEDTGQIFLKNAERATELPGVDFSRLTPRQKLAALRAFNGETCTCGCKLTLAQCRIYDSACQVSSGRTAAIVAKVAAAPVPAEAPASPPRSVANPPAVPKEPPHR
jgi:cytochrome c biogenesis protein CcmG/thiol:disulfide interchange protein DsbE